MIEVGPDGRILSVNSRTEAMFGYSREELIGAPIERLIPDEMRKVHEKSRETYAHGGKSRQMGSGADFAGQRKNGDRFSADVSLTRSGADASLRIVAFVRDVSHLRKMEAEERELRELTLAGLIETLNRVLSFSSELVFERNRSIQSITAHLSLPESAEESWQFKLAGALSLIGCVAVPLAIFEKAWSGTKLSREEAQMFHSHAAIGYKLIAPVPRLENVAAIIGEQHSNPPEAVNVVSRGVRMVQLAQMIDRYLYQGMDLETAVSQTRRVHPRRWDALAERLTNYEPPETRQISKLIPIAEIQPGMILDQDLTNSSGLLIALRGTRISAALLERIQNFLRPAN